MIPGAIASLLLVLFAASPDAVDSVHASIYLKLTAPDGGAYQTQTRRVLAAGSQEQLLGGSWGVALSVHPLDHQAYRVDFKILEMARFSGRSQWVEQTATSSMGQFGTPLEVEFRQQSLHLEAALFVSGR